MFKMDAVSSVVKKFQDIFANELKFKLSGKKPTLGQDGVGNTIFYLCYLCRDKTMFLDFLKECALIKTEMLCSKCDAKMKLKARKSLSDGFLWVCRCKREGKACGTQKSIRYGSWFSNSKLNLEEIFLLTYEIVKGQKNGRISEDFFFSTGTLCDWRQFINETILDHLQKKSEKIGGEGKIVDVGESKFGKRKYHREQIVEEEWVFGGVERGSGKFFLVTMQNRSAQTLLEVIENWIEKGTVIYSDSWRPYDRLGQVGYYNLMVNHDVTFVDPDADPDTKKYIKRSLPTDSRQGRFKFYFAVCLFRDSCKEKKVDVFNTFLEIVREYKWEESRISM